MKIRPGLFWLAIFIVILVLTGSIFLDHYNTIIASSQPSTDISLGVDNSQVLVVRFYYDSQQQLDDVAGQLDIWEVHPLPGIGPGSGFAVAAVYPAQKVWLEVLGYRVEIDTAKTAVVQSPIAVLDPRYFYFDSFNTNPNDRYMLDAIEATNIAYPGLTELLDIGDAWLANHGGYARDMLVLRITNEDLKYGDIESKPAFLLMANIHAREVSTPEIAIRYIKYLTDGYLGQGGYGIDPDVTWLVNHHVVYVLVSQNPDGHVINEANTAAYWRKNVDNDDGCSDSANWGVDLNRNSSFNWGCCGGSSSSPCSETYRGPSRASEPETIALQSFITQVFADWNGNNADDQMVTSPDNASGLFITLHSYADDILWPWGFAPGTAPNDTQLRAIGRKLAEITGVMNPTGGIGYLVDGSTDDWVYGKLGVAAFTYEIGPDSGSCGGFFPAYGCQDGIDGMPRNFWNEMKASLIYANKISPMPYRIVYGPDAIDLLATPDNAIGGLPISLSATISDQRYGSDTLQPVMAAEYFIDAPGEDGTGTPMAPGDGDWGGTSEGVEGMINTSLLSEGQHYILVHGKNDDGFWGPFTAIFLNITNSGWNSIYLPLAQKD